MPAAEPRRRNGGGNLISHDGGSLIGNDGSSLIGNDGSSLKTGDPASLIGNDGSSLIGNDGSSLVSQGGGNAEMAAGFSLFALGEDGMTTAAAVSSADALDALRLFYALVADESGNSGPLPAPDDYAGSTATTGTFSIGGSISGTLETIGDRDWFRVNNLIAGQTYLVDLKGAPDK